MKRRIRFTPKTHEACPLLWRAAVVFNSILFLLFFTVVMTVGRLVRNNLTWKRFLLLASYLFYASWGWWQVPLMAAITVVSFGGAAWIRASAEHRRTLLLGGVIALNLSALAAFKYVPFASEVLVSLGVLETALDTPPLPVGISFFTFQAISFVVDIRRSPSAPSVGFLDFSLYVAFFPQLVAGPIVRGQEILPQFERKPRPSADAIERGVCLFAIGAFLKSVLADAIFAPIATGAHSRVAQLTSVEAWVGCASFSGQIYCDFAGYSLCAIGCARVLGYDLPTNFRSPYAAASFRDFWRRWHISLSTWLRDHLYVPLGGSRHGGARTAFALVLTMTLGGLWHGASWTFVVWGVLHGAALVVERWRSPTSTRPSLAVLVLVCVLWIPFRAETWADATTYLTRLVVSGPGTSLAPLTLLTASVAFVFLVGLQWLGRDRDWTEVVDRLPPAARLGLASAALTSTVTDATGSAAFLYFQF